MPIKGLSEARRVPRLGKIRLGIKKKNAAGVEYPAAVDYFVCPPEVLTALKLPPDGKPKTLPIMFPCEDETIFAQQWYRRYSNLRGLVCKGDGETCARVVDVATGNMAERDTKEVVWKEGLPCSGYDCPEYQAKNCKTVMNLQFIMPSLPGLGVWQIDTGSKNSIININSAIDFIRGVYHRISFIPLTLAVEQQQVINPDDGKKKTVHVLTLKTSGTMLELMQASAKTAHVFSLPSPVVDEPPEDIEDDNGSPAPVIASEAKQPTPKQPGPTPGQAAAMQAAVDEADGAKQPAETLPNASVASQDGLGGVVGTKQVETVVPPAESKIFIDMEWLNGVLDKLKYQRAVSTKIKFLFPAVVIKDKNLVEIISQLSHEQQDKLVKELRERAESGGVTLD